MADDNQRNAERRREYEERRREREERRRAVAERREAHRRRAEEERRRRSEENQRNEPGQGSVMGKIAAGTAVGLGGGAMLFRTGTVAKFSRQIDHTTTFLSRTSHSFAHTMLEPEKPNIDNLRQFMKETEQNWKKTSEEFAHSEGRVRINATDRDNLVRTLHEMRMAAEDPSMAQATARREFIETTLLDHYDGKGTKENPNDFYEFIKKDLDNNGVNRIKKYIAQAAIHADNAGAMRITRAQFHYSKRSKAEQALMRDVEEKAIATYKKMQQKGKNGKSVADEINERTEKQLKAAAKKGMQIDKLEKKFGKKNTFFSSLLQNATGKDRGATVRDLFENESAIDDPYLYAMKAEEEGGKKKAEIHTVMDDMRWARQYFRKTGGKKAEKRFLNLMPDQLGLRMNAKDELYSISSLHNFEQGFLEFAAGTLPGKIMKLRDFQYLAKAPVVQFFSQGSVDPLLARIVNPDKEKKIEQENGIVFTKRMTNKSERLKDSYIQVGDELYRGKDDGSIELVKDPRVQNMRLTSGRFGSQLRLVRSMLGDTRYQESSNYLMHWFDIGQDRENFSGGLFRGLRSIPSKYDDPSWRGNVFRRLLSPTDDELTAMSAAHIMDESGIDQTDVLLSKIIDGRTALDFMNENIHEMSYTTVDKLSKNAPDKFKNIFDILKTDDNDEMLHSAMKYFNSSNDPVTSELSRLLHNIRTKPGAMNSIQLKNDRAGGRFTTSFSEELMQGDTNEAADIYKQVRSAIGQELFVRYADDAAEEGSSKPNYAGAIKWINSAGLGKDEANARRMAHMSFLKDYTQLEQDDAVRTEKQIYDVASKINDVFTGDTEEAKSFQDTFSKLENEKVKTTEAWAPNIDVESPDDYEEWFHVQKGISPLDILKSMNDTTKMKAMTKGFFKQWVAGGDDPENITTFTMVPYFFLHRLSTDMNAVGLGFSSQSMRSTPQFLANIALKRILPVAIGGTYLEWADDTSQEFTGTSISGAMANGVADADLAMRKVFDKVGLTDWLNEEKSINPIMQYWGDHTDFMGYDERKKYYESGYDPVRKGAWWMFGGVNEARGGQIEYWEASYDRRINSDYKDKALYDGYFDKWSHSLIPTPLEPFSPILGILDPYWLERKHEDDRPYPVSGPMWDEDTPWGVILNPTIGNLIKPQKELHPWRLHNGIDLDSLLHEMNDYVKDKARDIGKRNMFILSGNSVTPVQYYAWNAPTEDTSVDTYQISGGGDGAGDGASVKRIHGVYGAYDNSYVADPAGGSGNGLAGSGYGTSGLDTTAGPSGSSAGLNEGISGVSAASLLSEPDFDINYTQYALNKLFGNGGEPVQNGRIVTDNKGHAAQINILPADGGPIAKDAGSFRLKDAVDIDIMANGDSTGLKQIASEVIHKVSDVEDSLRGMNNATKASAARGYMTGEFDDTQGLIEPDKLKDYSPTDAKDLLNHPDQVTDLINQGKGYDLVHDAGVSWRLISGIYGYAGGAAFGWGDQTGKHIAKSSDMTSFSRSFWDRNFGGLGGNVADIIHRFIPDYKRYTEVNPLMNTMPDWMPERYRYGDPFTQLPDGEARLPGKGYEALNDLHSDQFGKYGAFDRYKILADIAPFSPEFKLWRDIAKKTVTDPELQQEMQDIADRRNQQGKAHDFYEYNVLGRGVTYKQVVVSDVLGYGRFRSGDTVYKVAGVSVRGNANESMQQVLSRYVHVGDTITVAVDDNQAEGQNRDSASSINAAVFVDGENISQQMLQNGDAVKRKGDTSAPATLPNYSGAQKLIAGASELIAHMDIPWLSDQFLRVRTAKESYEAEQVYGTPYQSWDHPIDSYLMPAIERAIHARDWWNTPLSWGIQALEKEEGLSAGSRFALDAVYAFSNRGAFAGLAVSNLVWTGQATASRRAMHIGSDIAALGHAITGGSGYFDEAMSVAFIGKDIAEFFKKDGWKGAAIGAAVGLAYRAITGNKDWVPERTRKKWQTEEYFDELTYTKYMGLYHAAAKKAKEEEGVDVEDKEYINKLRKEKIRAANDNLKNVKKALNNSDQARDKEERAGELLDTVNQKINALKNKKTVLEGGEWTHTALIYKQAADSTMTGLTKDSTWSQIVTALPKNDREYFMEFVKQSDPDKRNDILKIVSPQLRKALNLAWGKTKDKDLDPEKENKEYFKKNKHKLPPPTWTGWRPDVNLDDVEVKEIKNEGQLLSDFGYYESQLQDPNVINAPTIDNGGSNRNGIIGSRLKRVLEGQGLSGVDISVTTAADGTGTQILSQIGVYTGMKDVRSMARDQMKDGSQGKA